MPNSCHRGKNLYSQNLEETPCRLCSAKPAMDFDKFFLIFCDTCEGNPPILVLKTHRRYLTPHEKTTFDMIVDHYFSSFKPRGLGMKTEPRHWHEHLIPKETEF